MRIDLPGIALFAAVVLLGATWWSESARELLAKGWLRAYLPLSLLWLGVYPAPLVDMMNVTIEELVRQVGQSKL